VAGLNNNHVNLYSTMKVVGRAKQLAPAGVEDLEKSKTLLGIDHACFTLRLALPSDSCLILDDSCFHRDINQPSASSDLHSLVTLMNSVGSH